MEPLIFDSRKKEFKSPFGCVCENEKININIYIPHDSAVLYAYMVFEGEENFEIELKAISEADGYIKYGAGFSIEKRGLYFYYFKTNLGEFYNNGGKWQLSVLRNGYDTPGFLKGAIIYQIFPDRFFRSGECDIKDKLQPFVIHKSFDEQPLYKPVNGEVLNNDFFGGNLRGIAEKLDYLKSLSVSVIYLNPIFFAYSNHRYDTADYMRIDPLLGNDEDFKFLCEKAHKKGIKIILDVAFSHTGSNSIYFDDKRIFGNGAVSNPLSPYREWYNFERYPDKYDCWWGIKTLPCVNEINPSYMEYITGKDGVAAKYLRLGADGFRLDVVDEIPDEFVIKLRERVREEKPEAVLIGEVWEDASNKISYGVRRKYFTGCELDSIMNYPLRSAILRFVKGEAQAAEVKKTVMTLKENYPEHVFLSLMNSLSTHDTLRAVSYFDAPDINLSKDEQAAYKLKNKEESFKKLKIATCLQYFLPGCPTVYYGDEAGASGFNDPFNRGFFPWDSRDENLTEFFSKLGKLRSEYIALRTGGIEFYDEGEYILSFSRYADGKKINCIANLSDGVYNLRTEGKKLISVNCLEGNNICLIGQGGFYAQTSDN